MRRDEATKLLREELDKNGLKHWHIRLSGDARFIGLCDHKSQTIILNYHHIDTHPDAEIINTIKHEIAHALTPGHGHDEIWKEKAREIGCDNTSTVCSIALDARVIDAIRSGDVVEQVVTEEVVRKVEYKITRLQDKCPTCGKVAKEKWSFEANGKRFITLECLHIIEKEIPKETPFHTIVFDGDPNCKHVFVKEDGTKTTICEKCGAKRPYDFQIEGMKLLEKYEGRFGLFDEQGLGKTIQALGYIKFHPETVPFLYIAKSGLRFQAAKEIMRVLGPEYVPYIFETSRDFIFPGFKVYIISYDLLRRMKQDSLDKLKSIIKCIVIDEVQHIKNPDSSRTAEVRKLARDVKHIIPLSGSPWKNNGEEFFVVLNLINPKKFYSFAAFKRDWVEYYYHGNRLKKGGIRNIPKFKKYIEDVAIRRERLEVIKEFPLVNRTKLYVKLPKETMESYDDAVDRFVKIWNNLVISGEENSFAAGGTMMAALNEMRHIIGIAKIPATVDYSIEFLENTDRKLLIFVHHIDVGEMIYQTLNEYGKENDIKVVRLTSDMDGAERFAMQTQFNEDSNTRVAILSTLAAGEGLNLQTASDGIMHERQWNPMNEEQPEGRMARIGQQAKQINMIYTQAERTCDEDLDTIVEGKRIRFHNVMNKGEMPVWDQNSIIHELGEKTAERWRNRGKAA